MAISQTKQPILHFSSNTKGKDYVVGDLHGSYSHLQMMLELLDFDPMVDRLFSVGDLIDRGPQSMECAQLIYNNWFHAVRGNHEQMMINSVITSSPHHNEWSIRSAKADWYANGGRWGEELEPYQLIDLANDFDTLPYVISVGTGKHRFNIVHGEIINWDELSGSLRAVTDQAIDDHLILTNSTVDHMLWGRQMIRFHHMVDCSLYQSPQLSTTYCGHTPVTKSVRVGQQVYLDGGATYWYSRDIKATKGDFANKLIIASPSEQKLHMLPFADPTKLITVDHP